LPGLIAERFYNVMDIDKDGTVMEDDFVTTMINVFMSSVDTKLELSFKM
jgi:hypothetical protein